MPENAYMPRSAKVQWMRDETPDVRTLGLVLEDPASATRFQWRAGQFALFSVFGAGECVFTLANSPTRRTTTGSDGNGQAQVTDEAPTIECTFRAVGKITNALRQLDAGQVAGIRGPYGNAFDVEAWKGHHVAIVGGGIGMAAVRSPLQYVLDHRADYGEVHVLNGARSVGDVVYASEMSEWAQRGAEVVCTVDPGGETPDWGGRVGMIPAVFEELALAPEKRIVVACGPPVMLRYLFASLKKLGFPPCDVVTTLENRMKCGVGHCGRCNVGRTYLCTSGPVFTWAQLQSMPEDL